MNANSDDDNDCEILEVIMKSKLDLIKINDNDDGSKGTQKAGSAA